MNIDIQKLFGPLPSSEELEKAAAERHASAKAAVDRHDRFIATSLGMWMAHSQAAGVPSVPAILVGEVTRQAMMRIEDESPEDLPLWKALQTSKESIPNDYMFRWDGCSGSELKYIMSKPDATRDERIAAGRDHSPFCPRISDIHYSYPSDSIALWARPWIDALEIDGYPVEFRVFVRDSKVQGVASYYPQRPLPSTAKILSFALLCKEHATTLTTYLDRLGAFPWLQSFEEKFDPTKVNATMDFLIDKDNKVVFLEAGPPFGAGAHPCAFIDMDSIAGIALELAPGAQLR